MTRQRKVSIEDVARRAKVSITTVSRVINNVPTVSQHNRSKVEEAIAALKYKPDVSAQRLASGTNNAIGLVMPGYPGIFYSFYAIEIIRGVGHACETMRLDLVFHITNGFNPLNTNSVGGVIFADIIENRKQVEETLAAHIPCMVINNVVDDLDVNYIGIDNVAGGRIAADYLVSLGHQRIATVTGTLQTQAGLQRFEGFRQGLQKENIPVKDEYVLEGDYSRRSARSATEKLLALPQPPTAIFVASDDMALEVMAVIQERGMKVPDDISVIGFDDNPASLYGPVALTTIRQSLFQMAEYAVKYLQNIMSGKKKSAVQMVLTPQLVVRDSCRAPK
ncbi:MAG TPA: LacI family DNA-binding transcriptional regulator [Candidatus Omnitrophota bacterium]|nr:LacI family DNA-binding transcriptional regulator [Candidatus Omnitrophota bacterium]HQO57770.1 LacI family DNA-binding transcriptional regulator [Candidatus Omnitrophota bacterium]HQP11272.1 LacI family DNA-binding transcriptional regulator [Candidatus Omnitrophota bacterium]